MSAAEELARITARAEAATMGPWEVASFDSGHSRYELNVSVITVDTGDSICDMDGLAHSNNERHATNDGATDGYFIAAARTDVPRLVAALQAALALHQPVKKWEPYKGAGYVFATREEALRTGVEEYLGAVAIEAGPQFFEVCGECGRIEINQLLEIGEEWGYLESLWPCPTVRAITTALGETS